MKASLITVDEKKIQNEKEKRMNNFHRILFLVQSTMRYFGYVINYNVFESYHSEQKYIVETDR